MVDAWCDAGGVESIDLILRMTHSLLGVVPFHFVQYHTPFPDQEEIWRTCLNLLYIVYIIHDRIISHTSGRINYYHYSSIFYHSSESKLLLGWARPLWRGGPWQPLLQGRCRGTGPWRDAAAAILRDTHLHRSWGTSTWSETKEPQLLVAALFFGANVGRCGIHKWLGFMDLVGGENLVGVGCNYNEKTWTVHGVYLLARHHKNSLCIRLVAW